MGFKVHYGKDDETVNKTFCGKDYKLLNPTQFFLETFTLPKYPKNHHEFTLGIIVGTMSIGKSNMIRYLADLANRIYKDKLNAMYVKDIGAGIEGAIKYQNYVQFMAIDDAVTSGMDSRRSMSQENVSLSERFFMIRHELEDAYPAGYEIILLGTQDYEALDKRIRKNAHFTIFKNYYEEVEYKLQFDFEIIDFLKAVTDDALRKHIFEARSFCVGFTQIGDLVKLYVPEVRPADVPFIKHVDLTEKKQLITEQLITELIESQSLELGGVGAAHGFLIKRLESLEAARYIRFTDSDRTKIIYIARYRIAANSEGSNDDVKNKIKNEIRDGLKENYDWTGREGVSVIKERIRWELKDRGYDTQFLGKAFFNELIDAGQYYVYEKEQELREEKQIKEKMREAALEQQLTKMLKSS